ncbi:MAG: septum formation initiator family protein [Patescibacteria group bacterium]
MLRPKINPRVLARDGVTKPNNFFYRLVISQRFLAIIGLVFLLIIIIPLAKTYSQRRLVEKEIEDIKKEISDFENKNQELKDMIVYLESDQSLEEQARLNLNLKKPGEQVIVVEDSQTADKESNLAADSASGNNLSKWWQYFLN